MQVSIVIPCYNEEPSLLKETVRRTLQSLEKVKSLQFEIIVVNDGSKKYTYTAYPDERVYLINRDYNLGYGASLMEGILKSKYETIGIADSDGTYPVDRFNEFVELGGDMVIGKRPWSQIPLIRRPAKWVLHKFASFMAGRDVIDLNTGMRIFQKATVLRYKNLFPKRFSFTSTLTMIGLTSAMNMKKIDIKYSERVGSSSIRPIRDTIAFFSLVLRLSLYFNPLRIFMPISFLFFALATARGIRDYLLVGHIGGLCLVLFFMAFQIFFFGLIAEIINRRTL